MKCRAVFLDKRFVPGMLGLAQTWLALGRARDAQRSYTNAPAQLAQLPDDHVFPELENITAAQLAGDVSLFLQQIGSS